MSDDKRYTLAEAEQELARRQCLTWGHKWADDTERGDARPPQTLTCRVCRMRLRVQGDQ